MNCQYDYTYFLFWEYNYITRLKKRNAIWQVLPSHNIFLLQNGFLLILRLLSFFYPVNKNFKLLCILFGYCHTQILNFKAKINFANLLKIIRKSSKSRGWLNFWTIFKIFAKLIFALKFQICVWQHPNNMHTNFHKVFVTC